MLTTTKEMLCAARKNGYAVPAINTQGGNFDIIRAICLAAEEEKSPIILAHYLSTGSYAGDDWFKEVCEWWANKVSVPVAIHLDHGDSVDICKKCCDIGFTSVMYDGSSLSVEENAKNTNDVIKYAKSKNLPVEAEIGELIRLDGNNLSNTPTNTVKTDDVKAFLELCKPDSLAVGIGNAHGYYSQKPNIRLDILEEIARFSDIPLVLHGCTGMSEEIVKKAIKIGVAKINFGTQVRFQYVDYLKEELEKEKNGRSFIVMQNTSDRLKEEIKKIIRLSGSCGRV